jgi:branched-chain amino acid transport system substrate-binding protein
MNKKTWIRIVMVVVGFLIAVNVLQSCGQKERTISIGAVLPLTGDNAVFGVPQRNAAQLAVDEINAAGGVLGKQLLLVVEDDAGQAKTATLAAQKIVSDKNLVAVVGHPNSGCAIPASKIYHEAGVPFVTSTATNPTLTQQGYENVFRFAPTDDMQGFSIAEFILNKLGHKSAVLLHDNAAYGKGIEGNVKTRFTELGGNVLLEDAIDPKALDYKQVLLRIKQLSPPVVFYGGMLPQGTQLVKQAQQVGLETVFVFGDGCYDESFVELAGTDCRNVYISFLAAPVDQMESAKAFYDRYKARFGDEPSFFTPYAYDAVSVVADAISKAGSHNRAAIIRELHKPDYSFNGVTGPIHFNDKGQSTDRSFYFYTFDEHGELILVK